MQVIQIVGYKNSGKTTLTTALTELLKQRGFRVGTIKNHGHGGQLKRVEGTDSTKHLDAGAEIGTVIGGNEWQTTFTNVAPRTEVDLLDLYRDMSIDVTIIEGLKSAAYPKIILLRGIDDLDSLLELKNIQAIGGWIHPELISDSLAYELQFKHDEIEEYIDKIIDIFKLKR